MEPCSGIVQSYHAQKTPLVGAEWETIERAGEGRGGGSSTCDVPERTLACMGAL